MRGWIIDYFAAITAAGLLGFDPLGALIALGAMSLSATRRAHATLLASYFAAIATIGTAATLAARLGVGALHLERYVPSAQIMATAQVAAGIVALIIAVILARRPPSGGTHRPRRIPATPAKLAALGVGLAVSLVIDPGFLMLVALGATHSPWTYPPAFAYWGIWSQILMVGLCTVAILDRHGRATAATAHFVQTATARLPMISAIIVGVIGLALVAHGAHRWSVLGLLL